MLDRPVVGAGLLRAGHPRQPRPRPPRPGQPDLRPPGPPAQPTPGRFRTRVITERVTPSLHVDYKHTTIKQYHKEGRALRTETTINDTCDFGIGKRLNNLPALREIGFSANRRLLDVQRLSHDPTAAPPPCTAITDPVHTDTGTASPACASATPASRPALGAAASSGSSPRVHQPGPPRPPRTPARRQPGTSPPGRAPTTSAAFATTDSSNASHTATATVTHRRPPPGALPHPNPRPAPPRWPGRTHRAHPEPLRGSAQPATPTTFVDDLLLGQDSQPDPN